MAWPLSTHDWHDSRRQRRLTRGATINIASALLLPERVLTRGFGQLRELERQFMSTLAAARGVFDRDAEVLARDAGRLARFTDRIPGGGKRQA
ncbi:hypothetical protein [Rhodococcus sp. UNC363MFTsu5.1]|uniref:hypothetical protein n=1 Tax=Rhodococcus sp. UNC363MFTsu5.1 TaxID=1449069 RepID=UPI00056D0CE3|nr:hypothetical protein [Rhodococcus sp. UNC363MFTsu5.1]